jgi:hypothetical protein
VALPRLTLVALLSIGATSLAAQTSNWGDELPAPPSPADLRSIAPRLNELMAEWPAPPLLAAPKEIRALYVNAWAFGGSRFQSLVRLAQRTEVNALVIDIKDDTGYLTYASEVATAREIGANKQLRARDARARVQTLLELGIYPIARIVVAKDPLLAERKPAWAIRDPSGGLWRDRRGTPWVDAFNDSVWVYAAQLAAEAVRMGFAEVQFDYVRFPDEPRHRMATAVYPARKQGEHTRDGVLRNLHLLRDRMRAAGAPFTVDVFGMTTNVTNDMGIGQVWEDLVSVADVVLPMVYPSHYVRGMYGASNPNAEPYHVVRSALAEGIRRSAGVDSPAAIRPYLQAFTLGPPRYTPYHVREQIRAAHDLGIRSWVLWNPRSAYDEGIFLREHADQELASTATPAEAAP